MRWRDRDNLAAVAAQGSVLQARLRRVGRCGSGRCGPGATGPCVEQSPRFRFAFVMRSGRVWRAKDAGQDVVQIRRQLLAPRKMADCSRWVFGP